MVKLLSNEIVKVEFEVIDYSTGEKKYQIIDLSVPVFETKKIEWGDEIHFISKEQQIEEYIVDVDKSELMIKHDWGLIINWSVKSQGTKVVELINDMVEGGSKIESDFAATYIKMLPAIKDLSYEKQIQIILYALDLGYMASLEICKQISDILKDNKELIE